MILGLVAITIGRITFRRGDEPHCAKCHHNLSGLAPLDRCPECGASLTREGAVDRGAPVRYTRLKFAGFVLGLLGIAAMLGNSFFSTNPATVMAWLPDWAVAMQITGDGRHRETARNELFARIVEGSIGPGTIDDMVAELLERQADPNQPWDVFWGQTIEKARGLNAVSDADWHRYLKQGTSITLRARPRLRVKDTIPVEMFTQGRLGDLTLFVDYFLKAPATPNWTIGDVKPNFTLWRHTRDRDEMTISASIDHALTELGPQQVPVGIEVRVFDPNRALITQYRNEQTIPIEVVVDDPVRPARTSITSDDIRSRLVIEHLSVNDAGDGVMLHLFWDHEQWKPLDISLAFQVFARINGTEHSLRTIAAPRGVSSWRMGLSGWAQGANRFDRIDIILRADPKVARNTVDIFEYWDGEIVFENVEFRDDRKDE